jgi:hypothetical protein
MEVANKNFFMWSLSIFGAHWSNAGLTCEKNILACIANVFECEVELGIGDEAHVKFPMYGQGTRAVQRQYCKTWKFTVNRRVVGSPT